MNVMQLARPHTVADACNLLADLRSDAVVVSGGVGVVPLLRQRLIAPRVLVSLQDLNHHDGHAWRGIDVGQHRVRVGAGTTLTDLERSPIVRQRFPSLVSAVASVGNARIRNVATIGGHLAEADYATDPPSALVALNASCSVVGPEHKRIVAVADLITGHRTTVLGPGELITEVHLPLPEPDRHAVYLKYRSRSSHDRPLVAVAATARHRRGALSDVRVVVGAVTSAPVEVNSAMHAVEGSPPTRERIAACARLVADGLSPISDGRGSAAYRRRVVEVHVRRALHALSSGDAGQL